MFSRKKKKNNKTEISYDIDAYNAAYAQWGKERPRLSSFKSEHYFMSGLEERSGVYFSWAREAGQLYISPFSKHEDTVQQFSCFVLYNSVLMYTLERFLHSDEIQAGCVLEPVPSYYYGPRHHTEYSVIIIRQPDDILVEWYDHTSSPEEVIQQHYTEDDLTQIVEYLFDCKEHVVAFLENLEKWREAMPQHWQFPPIRDEEEL
jgi:hypothetical protein